MGSPRAITRQPFVVLFDGVCNLCSGSVQFIIKRDPHERFKFASLQSEYGKRQLLAHGFNPNELHSIILLVPGAQGSLARGHRKPPNINTSTLSEHQHIKAYNRSNAALEIAKHLSGLWPMFYMFKIIPRFIRDWLYNRIAQNRYRFFGKKDACLIPTPELRFRFLD